jgi:hypothetical protein
LDDFLKNIRANSVQFFDGETISVRCFVCPTTDEPHSLVDCKLGLGVGNEERYRKHLESLLCSACLRKDCFKNQMKTGEISKCANHHLWISCDFCVEENNQSGRCLEKPKNPLICIAHEEKIESLFVTDDVSTKQNIPTMESVMKNVQENISLTKSNATRNMGNHVERKPQCGFNSESGLPIPVEDLEIVDESAESVLYFLQWIMVGESPTLVLFDIGVTGSVILGQIA